MGSREYTGYVISFAHRHCGIVIRHLSSLKTYLKFRNEINLSINFKMQKDYLTYSSIHDDTFLRHDSTNLEGRVNLKDNRITNLT